MDEFLLHANSLNAIYRSIDFNIENRSRDNILNMVRCIEHLTEMVLILFYEVEKLEKEKKDERN